MTDPTLERWRLLLGEPGGACLGGQRLDAEAAARDAAMDWLYGRDDDLRRRGVRRGGTGPSALTTVDWLDDITRLFPKETVERLHRDAVERYEIHDVVTDPDVLARIEPDPALLRAVLRTKHLMNPQVLRLARRIVEQVVRQLVDKLATEVRTAFSGTKARRHSRMRLARNFDVVRTLRANLGRYQPATGKVVIETPFFFSRTRRHLEQWQVILLVDQSGSMLGSVIHSAVTAACLWGLPGVRTHLVAFDTEVVDLTADVDDPVELLMKVQLGGGTDIARAAAFGASLVDRPRRAIVVLISDFYEGGDPHRLVHVVRDLVAQGSKVLGLAALDEQANPDYDRALAQRLADAGAQVGAMTPGELASFVAEHVGR
ncbi:VWA domain-containing protein [Nonomuraea rhodomycinica]|uniref:VWA domain-containing protein n=1 Tax=Nonomuraea rhodomycinica TaxID=1712872 RepID=A0A7Y6IQI3_9ACTN|nr:VWA domain-containing protein [Nonomuraea rhodomycinica]NUW42551.1 VWA domain-containing protein [Nonomuraea rhodomycinica]